MRPVGRGAALIYMTHRLDPGVLAGWTALRRSCADHGFHPVFLYDNSRADFIETAELAGADRHLFTFTDLATRYIFRVYDPHRPLDQGNATFPILDCAAARPGHAAYWRIEYDVFFDGEWRDFFTAFDRDPADLLTTTLYRPAVRPDWGWWPTLQKPWHDWHRLRPVRAFMPVARFSPKALATVDKAYRRGWAGHDEVLVPSVLASHGLRIADLGGEGEFTRAGAEGRFYTNAPTSRGLAPGTFVCPPHLPTPDPRPGRLYHPVKDRLDWLERRDAGRFRISGGA